jgi:hypothetical protein
MLQYALFIVFLGNYNLSFVEADTDAHCRHSLAGDFVWSLTLSNIDIG